MQRHSKENIPQQQVFAIDFVTTGRGFFLGNFKLCIGLLFVHPPFTLDEYFHERKKERKNKN